ncbi:MAG: Type 1 glutamine amidotransferase-like domain-containing protein [Patescibacteria group bacterium]|jgi:dipeptidase E
MRRIILASSDFQKSKDLRKNIIALLQKPVHESSAVIITTASVEWKESNKHAALARQILEEIGFKDVAFLDIEFEDRNELKKYDVIYINGGNPFYLLYHLKKSTADEVIIKLANQGAVLVGISAGAVVLGPNINIVDYLERGLNIVGLKDLSGLHLDDQVIYPHYTKEIEDKIKLFEKKFKVEVKRLSDEQSIIIKE